MQFLENFRHIFEKISFSYFKENFIQFFKKSYTTFKRISCNNLLNHFLQFLGKLQEIFI